MGKKINAKQQPENIFYMKGFAKTYYKKVVKVLFEGDRQQNSHQMQESSLESTTKANLPTYNHDKNVYTPAFIIPSISISQQNYVDIFNERLGQVQSSEQQELMMPRPKNKTYCNVCKLKFQDYLEHSQSQKHVNELKNDKFQKKIDVFIKQYNGSGKKVPKSRQKPAKIVRTQQKQQSTVLKEDDLRISIILDNIDVSVQASES